MKSDITRKTFDSQKHYSRVIVQQGRVQLDADWNEQACILLHHLRTMAGDLIGPHGGPTGATGFEIITDQARLKNLVANLSADDQARLLKLLQDEKALIGTGRYYVDGVLCENESFVSLFHQPDYSLTQDEIGQLESQIDQGVPFLIYLDVWERHLTWLDDDRIREVALGGPDTASRAKIVWQVRARPMTDAERRVAGSANLCVDINGPWEQWKKLQTQNRGQLKARVMENMESDDPCVASPQSLYRGAENQLYRVEIHRGGSAWDGKDPAALTAAATFKWSRDNGSVVAAWLGKDGNDLTVAGVHDTARGFAAGQWVELSHDDLELKGQPGTLVQISKVDGDVLTIDPNTASGPTDWSEQLIKPKVRRWDQQATENNPLQSGAVPVVEGPGKDSWISVEDGVQIQFQPLPPAFSGQSAQAANQYRSGDYWLIPARVATGNVEWPVEIDSQGNTVPSARPPLGIQHHYAPLAGAPATGKPVDLRHKFNALAVCAPATNLIKRK